MSKLSVLRAKFVYEFKIQILKQKIDPEYCSKWKYYDLLDFLEPTINIDDSNGKTLDNVTTVNSKKTVSINFILLIYLV